MRAKSTAQRDNAGFEVSGGGDIWTSWVAHSQTRTTVTLVPAGTVATWPEDRAPGPPAFVRYLWSQAPCTHPRERIGNCSVYAKDEGLPAGPFMGVVSPSAASGPKAPIGAPWLAKAPAQAP